jgi:ABC-type multidrug transport system ATPase subunit
MGVCPQHNVLFDSLTVTEHLSFFQKIKGLKPSHGGLRQSAQEIGLGDYLRTTSSALSGGNKRKLSLAIALCGDPQFLLLDEPTSGMDVASRRNCWELLRKKRQGRVTLLTTHFLDEASLLADRIAVMKEGQLQCCGSELFLKNRFGLGYNLTVVLAEAAGPVSVQPSVINDEAESLENGTLGSPSVATPSASSRSDAITIFLNQYIANTKLIRKSARELTFRFPQGSEASFPDIFDALVAERTRLAIGAYGISDTSLEEIFLQLAESDETPENKVESVDTDSGTKESTDLNTADDTKPGTNDLSVSNDDLHHLNPFKQIALLYRKRFVVQRRDIKGACFQIVLPVLLCGLVLLVLTLEVVLAGPPIEMSMGLYESAGGGSSAATDVTVGGGMTLETTDARRLSTIDDDFSEIRSSLGDQYPNAKFVHLEDAASSSDVSQHLLDTYNDQTHNTRYGSFALYDRINMIISVDWDELKKDFRNFLDSAAGGIGAVHIGSLLDINGSLIDINITRSNAEEFVAQLTNMTENATVTIDTISLRNTTQGVLQRIVDTAFTVDATGVQELREAFTTLVNSLTTIQVENATATLGDAVGDALVGFLNDILTTVTEGVIQDINGTSLEEIVAALVDRVEIFDRDVIIEGMIEIFDELLGPFGGTRDTSEAIVNLVIDTFDGAASLITGSNITSSPNDLLILPVLLLDEFAVQLVDNFGPNATVSLSDVFDTIEDVLNQNGTSEIGYLHVKAESATVDFSSRKVKVKGISIETMSEVLVDNETLEADLLRLLNVADALLPSDSNTFVLAFSSDVSILHNSSSPHAVGAFNQAYMEYLYKQCTENPLTSRLVSVNHPLPVTEQQAIEIKVILSILSSLFLLIPLCYIPGAFIVFIVKERMSKSKHLQLVSGVELTSYWISTYLWDLTLFFVLTLLLMAIFLIYGRESAVVFVGDTESFFATMALVFGYGLSILPFSYLLSRGFNNHSSAQIAVMGLIFISGFVAVNAYFIMSSIESTQKLAEALRPMFRWWPAYNIGEGFIQLSTAYFEREILGSDRSPLDWDVAGKPLALNYSLAFPYFLLLLLLEYSDDGGSGGPVGRILRQMRSSWGNMILRWHGVRKGPDGVSLLLDDGLDEGRGEDDDVVDERVYVKDNKDHLKVTASVLLVNMWKVFPPTVGPFGKIFSWIRRVCHLICCCGCFRKQSARVADDSEEDKSNLPKRAVRGVSTAIMEGETYGLLGGKLHLSRLAGLRSILALTFLLVFTVNGAGKTTTLGVLTGDIGPTSGEAYVAGHDVTGITPGGVAAARKHIGFCPQVDPLLDLMTGRETLRMFGRLRGIPLVRLEATVNTLLDRLTLTPHADKVSESYSGGNKRKLSLGIALIGDPRVLFIDEASSGMDPSTRRKTWGLIEQAAVTRSVILTSHSMEEVEALCTRVGIMVKGQFLCLGSVQHLKSKYLDGYTIDVQCAGGTPDSEVQSVVNTILTDTIPQSTLAERHGSHMRFDVSSIGLGDTFRKLQHLKDTSSVANYSISQCSLEQVFIKLVKSGTAEAVIQQVTNDIAQAGRGVEMIDDVSAENAKVSDELNNLQSEGDAVNEQKDEEPSDI